VNNDKENLASEFSMILCSGWFWVFKGAFQRPTKCSISLDGSMFTNGKRKDLEVGCCGMF
jgi:hypothetical protein